MAQCYLVVLLTLSLTSALLYQVSAFTDPSDDLYRELNYPQQLIGWNSGGGDPCEVSWKGISCNGSSVIFINQINGLEISGRLEDQLFNLVHLKQQPVGNVLSSLQNLKRMDLSNNNFTGDLPTSFQDLKNLTALNLPNSFYSKDLLTLFEEQEEKEQQPPQPDQEQQQPPQPEQEQQPQADQEQQQQNVDEVADAGEDAGGNGGEAGGDGEDDEGEEEEDEEEEEEEEENEAEEDENEDHETKEADNFCRLDDPKSYGDDRLPERIKRTITHFHRKD